MSPNHSTSQEAKSLPKRGNLSLIFWSLKSLLSGKVARQGYLAAVDQGVISLANFSATIILARKISPTELGVYGVGFIALRLTRSLQEGLIVQPMNVFGAGMDAAEFKRYASSSGLIQAGLAIATSLAAALGGWILTALGNDTAGPVLFALWFAFLSWQMQEYIRRLMYTRGDVFFALVNTVLANGIRLGLMIWWASTNGLSGIAGLNAIAWGSLGALVLGLLTTPSYWSRDLLDIKETWRRNWGFGRWILGGTLANWLSVEFYPVLTAGLISFAAAGAYRALQNLVAPVHMLLRATDTFLTPRAAQDYDKNGRRSLVRTLRLIYLFAGVPVFGLLVLAIIFPVPLLRLLYGETYLPYSNGMVLMAIFYALWFAYWPLQTALKAARISRPIFIANLAATFAMFTLGIWAIHQWGVYGTIAGQALNSLVVGGILWGAWLSRNRGE